MVSSATDKAIFDQPGEIERLAGIEIGEYASLLADCDRVWLVAPARASTPQNLALQCSWRPDWTPVRYQRWISCASRHRSGAQDGIVVITHTAETAFALAARAKAHEAGPH